MLARYEAGGLAMGYDNKGDAPPQSLPLRLMMWLSSIGFLGLLGWSLWFK